MSHNNSTHLFEEEIFKADLLSTTEQKKWKPYDKSIPKTFQSERFHYRDYMISFSLTENNNSTYTVFYHPRDITVYSNKEETIFIISATSQGLASYKDWYIGCAKSGRLGNLCVEIHNPYQKKYWKTLHQILTECFSKDARKKQLFTILQNTAYNITINTHILYPSLEYELFQKKIIPLSKSYHQKENDYFYTYHNTYFDQFSKHERLHALKKIVDIVFNKPLYSREYR